MRLGNKVFKFVLKDGFFSFKVRATTRCRLVRFCCRLGSAVYQQCNFPAREPRHNDRSVEAARTGARYMAKTIALRAFPGFLDVRTDLVSGVADKHVLVYSGCQEDELDQLRGTSLHDLSACTDIRAASSISSSDISCGRHRMTPTALSKKRG